MIYTEEMFQASRLIQTGLKRLIPKHPKTQGIDMVCMQKRDGAEDACTQ